MIPALLILYLLIYLAQSACVSPTPYRLAANNTCWTVCPWSPPTMYYASPLDNTCQTLCPSGWFGFDGNKTCTQTCPTAPNMTFYDTVNRKCVVSCPTGSFSYLGADATANQKCVTTCPAGTFAQQLNRQCVTTCPSNTFYKNDSTPFCVLRCPDNQYGSPIDKNCKVGGSCPTTPVRYFADDTTNMCVQSCPANTFADITTGRCLKFCSATYFADSTTWRCVQTCPVNYYRSNVTKSCLLVCTEGFFIDRLTGNCTQSCSTGTFGDFATGFCEEECTFPTFSDTVVGRCVNTCSFGLYADNFTSACVTTVNCYANLIGDPTTRRCVEPQSCPTAPYHFANLVAKVCTPKCPPPLWGDKSTETCVSACPWNPGTYVSWKNPDTQECVTRCPEFPILYADNSTQTCVATCPAVSATVLYDTFADDISQQCVRVCPNGFKSQKPQHICISQCSNTPTTLYFYHVNSSCLTGCPSGYYADSSRQVCTQVCPTNPELFALDTNNSCVPECPNGLYADLSTKRCVTWCPETTLQYADNSTNECVDACPISPDYYGLDRIDGNKVCVLTCDVGLFADPLTRTCVPACNIEKGYYGELTNPVRKCVLECNPNFYADNITKTCVAKCPDFPEKFYGNPFTKKCEKTCPEFLYGNSVTNVCGQPSACQTGFFADDLTNKCVRTCPVTQRTYGQSTKRRCLKECPEGRFADDTTRRCEITCNATARLFKDPSTNRCVQNCPTRPNLYNNPLTMSCDERCTGGFFAYDGTRRCVAMCPSTPAFFGNIDTFRCVDKCPAERYRFVTNLERTCRPHCPISYMGDTYADNSTWSCVTVCPKAENLYSFKHPTEATIRTCVKICPVLNTNTLFYFADNVTQSCVQLCPLRRLSWGDKFTLKCQRNCTRNQFRDNITVQCTYECTAPRFADNTTWDCVTKCPNGTYAYAMGTNRTCLRECPTGFYADNNTNFCRALCDNDVALWSDNTTWSCVKTCPSSPDLYADPNTDKCEYDCSGGLYADKLQRKCVTALNCSTGTIGDPRTYRCVARCPIEVPSFWQVSTNKCVTSCLPGFYADNFTMKCQQTCSPTPDYYAFNDTTLGPICVLYCPATYYRHLPNRTCLQNCPAPDYFQDPTTMKCVKTCPDHYFAESVGQVCVTNCSGTGKYGLNNICMPTCTGQYSADPTTFLCVKKCPFTYFSQANVCKQTCTVGYADPITKVCEPIICSVGYYVQTSTKKCVRECKNITLSLSQYKYDANQTCLPSCPKTADHATNLYMDNNTFMCINKCQPGWYADNATGYCNTACSTGLFADNSTGRCVPKCPASPDFFGYNKVCHFPCPKPNANTNLFAENTTRECLLLCPNGSYADKYNRRCMDVCTLKQYAYTNLSVTPVDNICVEMCPEGYYASDKSKSCVLLCDLGTYGENVTNKCLKTCPTSTYADDFLRLCVLECNEGRKQFSDWSTQRCVTVCPSVPNLYARNSSRSCVAACGIGWFGLNTTRVCTQSCPVPFYADPTTGFCELKCHIGTDRFADDVSRSCVVNCPNYTDPVTNKQVITYEDNSTKTCVKQCPFFPSLYGFNQTNACLEDCPSGTFGDNDTRLCLDKCFWNVTFNAQQKFTWADSFTGFCTKQCTKGSFADNKTVSCVSNCSQGTFSQNSTWRCVHNCPVNPVSFAKRQTRQCVQRCDVGFFGDELSRRCVQTCPKQPYFYYMDFLNQRCVKNCTSTATTQYFAEDLSQSCVTDCTIGYFKSLSRRACVQCPSSCLVCYAELNCTSCQPGLFLHDGSCIQSCPSFPIRYYANVLSSKCVKQCPSPYFGFNGTGKCELTCPQKYFSDITDNSCKLCNTGCRRCITKLNCTSCLTGYVYVSQYSTCSKVCNITHIYYVQNKCQFSCIDGTFLLSDLVTCQKCSTACATCSMSGTNCTKCNNKFWYNFNCVTECPKGFYADANNSCIDCKINQAACSVETLRYNVETFTKDYKVFAFVKFNRPISLGKSVANRFVASVSTPVRVSQSSDSDGYRSVGASDDYRLVGQDEPDSEQEDFSTLMIIKTSKGPLKASSFRATKYNESVFLVQFFEATSLNEMVLSVDFVPGSIVDTFGNGLAESSKTIQIATLETVSLQIKQAAVQMKQNVNVLGWILVVVLGLMMLKITYPLLVLIDFLQLIYMHLYVQVSPLPYFWMNIMSSMQNVNFVFLPQFHSEPDETSANPYSYFKKDITMLGNIQPLVYIGGAFGAIYLIFWGVSSLKIKAFRCFRKRCRRLFKDRMRFSLLNQIFYYTQLQVFFFAVLQWPANRSAQKAVGNLAASIAVFAVYVAWLVFLLYKSSHYSKSLQSMPKRYRFLVLEPSQFPLDMALRYLLKLMFCLCLLLPQKSIQLIFLMTINGVYFFYNLIYKPSISKITNYMNMFVALGLIGYEICLFAYGLTNKGATIQQQFSLMLLAIPGVVLVGIIAWILYRLFMYIKVDLLKIGLSNKEAMEMVYQNQQEYEKDKEIEEYQSTKNQNVFSFFNINKLQSTKLSTVPKSQYKKISSHHEKSMVNDDDEEKSGKNMLPELQFNQEDEEDDSQPEINEQEVMKEFSYHMVPKKNEALLKAQEKVMQKNQDRLGFNNANIRKKKLKGSSMPIVIAIDEDELIDKNIQIIDKTKATNLLQQPKKQGRIKSSKSKKEKKPSRIDTDDVIFDEAENRSEHESENIISVVNSVNGLQE